ncbi:phage tail tape measure C-terminal domain-containing protein [Paludibacterium denitrificans]|uniref:Bacteriophage tail tape measure C-terminal domain-containing protein n=1 Tax=Paludibacterium denitrificans TaxID=2675226 RepID=A0A844GH91_9NEIS|nr:phage tail tape measure C-terminal domain-containing protein [Paludibacterium denitrificans]MTD34034.1 hypothetical protein [Paludibacterium denitrificans]
MLLTQQKEVNAVLTSGYNKLNAETVKYIDGLQSEVDLIGATSLQRKEAAVMLDMEAKERQLLNEAAKKSGLSDEQFIARNPKTVAEIRAVTVALQEQRLKALASHEATMNEFSTGWDNAMAAYKDKASNNATAAANIFNAMTTSMESTLLNFFNTGKMGWQDFAKAVLVEIEKILIAKQAAGLVGSISLGWVMQWASNLIGGQTQTAAPIESGVASWTATQANGGAWSHGVQLYANGGVFDRPTAFAHAVNGLGVLGEAGPEAVMPLTRGADGKLGVKASGQGGGGDVVIQQTFYIQQDGTVKQTGDAGQYQQVTQQMADAMTGIARQSIVKAMLPGGEIATVYGNKL